MIFFGQGQRSTSHLIHLETMATCDEMRRMVSGVAMKPQGHRDPRNGISAVPTGYLSYLDHDHHLQFLAPPSDNSAGYLKISQVHLNIGDRGGYEPLPQLSTNDVFRDLLQHMIEAAVCWL